MKFCPQCNLEFEDETVFCPRDGSQLQQRVAKLGVMKLGARPAAAGMLGGAALTSAAEESLDTTRPIPSLAMNQAATVKAPPLRRSAPRPRVASEMQRTAPSPRRDMPEGPLDDEGEATSVHSLPEPEAGLPPPGAVDFLDVATVAMAVSPVKPPEPALEDLPMEQDEPDLSGRSLAGRYRLLKKLGEGGMGVVYAALDERIEKQIAIKVLREEFVRRQDVVARFTQEARSAGRIKHENVLDVTDYGRTEDNGFYIAMELLVGTDLADVLHRDTTLAPERGIDIAIQICRALAAAHREGVVHRDLKPENVFLVRSDDGREVVKIVDFGIAQLKDGAEGGRKLTRTGMIFGTPEYMSPEQAAGRPIDLRVDVYATGVILYEMFTGRVPFHGDSFMGVLTQHMFEAVPAMREINPSCAANEDLEAVIFKALAKDPAQRYANMTELAEDLQRVRSGLRPNAPQGYDGTGTFLRSQMLQGARGNPGAIAPSVAGEPAVGVGVSRTMESELAPPRSRGPLLAGFGVGLTLMGLAVAWALSQSASQPAAQPAASPPSRPEVRAAPQARPAPHPAPQPAVAPPVVDAGPPMIRLSVTALGGPAEIWVQGEASARCAATPCEISVRQGASLPLTARSGSRSVSSTVRAETDGQAVVLSLPAERSSRGSRGGHSRPTPSVAPSPATLVTPPTLSPPRHRTGTQRPCTSNTDCDCWIERLNLNRPCL
ncbi:MAG: serine/threonine-protein kinase [Polyangiales bacterium]